MESHVCNGKCNKSYRECLTSRKVNLKENGLEMNKLHHLNLNGLFSRDSTERLPVSMGAFMRGRYA